MGDGMYLSNKIHAQKSYAKQTNTPYIHFAAKSHHITQI